MPALDTPISDLTQEQYESLPPREYAAVSALLVAQESGRISPMSSDNDLTPRQLAEESEAAALAMLVQKYGFEARS